MIQIDVKMSKLNVKSAKFHLKVTEFDRLDLLKITGINVEIRRKNH